MLGSNWRLLIETLHPGQDQLTRQRSFGSRRPAERSIMRMRPKLFRGDCNQRFTLGLPADYPFFFSAPVGSTSTSIAPAPGAPSASACASKARRFGNCPVPERAVDPGRCPILTGDGPHRPEPQPQRLACRKIVPAVTEVCRPQRAHSNHTLRTGQARLPTLDSGNPLASARRTDSRGKPPRSQSETRIRVGRAGNPTGPTLHLGVT